VYQSLGTWELAWKLSGAGREIYFIQNLLNGTALNCTEILQKMYELNGVRALAGYLVIELYKRFNLVGNPAGKVFRNKEETLECIFFKYMGVLM